MEIKLYEVKYSSGADSHVVYIVAEDIVNAIKTFKERYRSCEIEVIMLFSEEPLIQVGVK